MLSPTVAFDGGSGWYSLIVSRFVAEGLEGIRLSRLALEATEKMYGTFESGQKKERKRV